jgi:hypothetical protein
MAPRRSSGDAGGEGVSRITDQLRRLGYHQEADEAARTLPAQVSAEELTAWGDRHRINRDELMSRMGGSP